MDSEERYSHILKKISKDGQVKVSDLAEEMNVSEVTVRKDLSTLEKREFLKRNFGGAVSIKTHVRSLTLEEKKIDNIELKKIIAQKADELITDNMDIFLDAGTTTYALIDNIVKHEGITVITFDLNIAMELAKYKHIKTYILGGFIENETLSSLSLEGYQMLEKFHTDICFAGTDAFDDEYVYSTNHLKSHMKTIMLDNAKVKVLVTDSSKYPKDGLYRYYKLTGFDYIITDKQNEELNALLDNEIREEKE